MKKKIENKMNKSDSKIINNMKKYKEYIFLFIVVSILCLLTLYSSPLYKGLTDVDSSVFQIMGKGMLEHKIIYRDLFDHKGPIVYIINAIGFFINNKYGLFIVEIIVFYIGTIFVYKTSRIVLSKKLSIVVDLLYMLISFSYFYGGNCTEEYAITFMSIAMYFIIKILYNKEMNKKIYWIIIGSTFTINLLIKPTYISIWMAFGIVQLISSIKDKKIKELIKNIGYIIIGVLIIFVPIMLYLIINNAVSSFIYAYINMNMKYSSSSIFEKIKAFASLSNKCKYNQYLLMMLISNIAILCSKKINKRTKNFITLFSIISLILTSWAPNSYGHYLIQLAPCVTLESIFLCYLIEQRVEKKEILNYKIIRELPLNFIYVCVIIVATLGIFEITSHNRGIFLKQLKIHKIVIERISEINNYLNEEDKILVLGNNSYYYLLLNRQPDFKYFFQYPIMEYDEKIKEETEKYVLESRPKVIINERFRRLDMYSQEADVKTFVDKILEVINQNYEEHDIGVVKYYVLKEQ